MDNFNNSYVERAAGAWYGFYIARVAAKILGGAAVLIMFIGFLIFGPGFIAPFEISIFVLVGAFIIYLPIHHFASTAARRRRLHDEYNN
jgi:zinc transporter ZupT